MPRTGGRGQLSADSLIQLDVQLVKINPSQIVYTICVTPLIRFRELRKRGSEFELSWFIYRNHLFFTHFVNYSRGRPPLGTLSAFLSLKSVLFLAFAYIAVSSFGNYEHQR